MGGPNWEGRGLEQLPGFSLVGVSTGRSYVDWLRRGKIVVAPIQSVVHVGGTAQPGDQVSARTFECAAAYTFFIHPRTDEAKLYYDEATEVPMYSDGEELGDKIGHFLQRPEVRQSMAAAAHRRAVPAYSVDAQTAHVLALLEEVASEARAGQLDDLARNDR